MALPQPLVALGSASLPAFVDPSFCLSRTWSPMTSFMSRPAGDVNEPACGKKRSTAPLCSVFAAMEGASNLEVTSTSLQRAAAAAGGRAGRMPPAQPNEGRGSRWVGAQGGRGPPRAAEGGEQGCWRGVW